MAAPALTIVLGTRGSALARWQTDWVLARLREHWPDLASSVRVFTTTGDRLLDTPLPALGGKGVFTAELEDALLKGEIDVAVHSLKDLPVAVTPGLALGAICERVDARDIGEEICNARIALGVAKTGDVELGEMMHRPTPRQRPAPPPVLRQPTCARRYAVRSPAGNGG